MKEGQPRVSIVAAMDRNRGIGKDNKLLFKIDADFERMKKIIAGKPIIMGRKTHESILTHYTRGKLIPGSRNIVVTRDPNYANIHTEGCIVCHSLDEALQKAKEDNTDEIIIFGGANIYQEALPITDRLYLTVVDDDKNADAFFPDYSEFKKVVFEESHKEDGLKYKFLDLER